MEHDEFCNRRDVGRDDAMVGYVYIGCGFLGELQCRSLRGEGFVYGRR
jgi:hypothetical protein